MKEKKEKKPWSKKRKILTWSITGAAVFFFVLGLGLGFGYVDPALSRSIADDGFHGDWMSYVNDEARLRDVAMPGSHDSGTNGMMAQAMTQGHDIGDQLLGGSRYFDIRVTGQGDDLVIFHGPAKGQKFSKVLDDISGFLNAHQSEFIIMDFQHLGDGVHGSVIDMIKAKLPPERMLSHADHPEISAVKFSEIRAGNFGYMIVWTAKNETEVDEAEANGFYTRKNGLRSEYDEKAHKAGDEELIAKFDEYYANSEPDKIFVLQAQRTAKTLLGRPSDYEKRFAPKVLEFVKAIPDNPDYLAKTNVIMRDFVVSDEMKIDSILRINLYKENIIIADKIDAFKAAVGER